MRRGIMLGLGLAGVAAVQATAAAQFAADRGNPPPTPPAPAAPAPEAPQQPPAASHPWYVRPDLGPWMICVKSYTGPDSKKLAEELAAYIRQAHKAGAYLFEWGGEEREKERQRQEEVRRQKQKEYAPFLAVREQMKAKAAAEGLEFLDTPTKYRLGKIDYPEQWAVLIGGFKDMDAARKALDVVRKWKPPENTALMDQAVIVRPGENGVGTKEVAHINPFAAAMTAPNPAVHRSTSGQAPPADPAVVKLNEAEELSLLNARKPWTLMVKRFVVPTQVQGRSEDGTVFDRLFGGDDAAKWLEATARQARELAKALRSDKQDPKYRFETFVLHYRTESLVTVGQFDSPDDPALIDAWYRLTGMTFRVDYKDGRPPETKKMFDVVIPMQVPRVTTAAASAAGPPAR
jgi:hypothetical protein